jgi:hypothetical protein
MPSAQQVLDVPILAVWDGSRCGPKTLQTAYGRREAFGARVVTEKDDMGLVMFFWTTVVNQLRKSLRVEGDAVALTVHKEGRKYVATPIDDEATLAELEASWERSHEYDQDRDAPAEPDTETY